MATNTRTTLELPLHYGDGSLKLRFYGDLSQVDEMSGSIRTTLADSVKIEKTSDGYENKGVWFLVDGLIIGHTYMDSWAARRLAVEAGRHGLDVSWG